MPNLRDYVRHAELYGGYESVFEEAAKELHPRGLAHLCTAMRPMSREYRSGSRTMRESFKLGSRERKALVVALIREEVRTGSIADLLGCSTQYVREVRKRSEMGSESPQTGGLKQGNGAAKGIVLSASGPCHSVVSKAGMAAGP